MIFMDIHVGGKIPDAQLSSILVFSMNLKRIQNPHRLLWDFWAGLYSQPARR